LGINNSWEKRPASLSLEILSVSWRLFPWPQYKKPLPAAGKDCREGPKGKNLLKRHYITGIKRKDLAATGKGDHAQTHTVQDLTELLGLIPDLAMKVP
jgi:hypothetical protein